MAMTWSTSQRPGQGQGQGQGSSLAQQFPFFQISAKDARRGAVKVEARAPSGKMHEMSVIDNNGVYTANFTPTEVGDWSVAIKYEGQHIQGSPFNVRVYDASQVKVYGLQGGTVGKNFSFSVDASGAGEGEMTVNITHDGAMVPAQIAKDPGWPGRYTVGFTPSGSGMYNIRVYFAGIEVTGSPYTLEIVDASQVTATGEGLSTVEINRRAAFVVNTGHISSTGDLKVEVTGPRGNKVPSTVTNNNNGTHTVEYVPSDVGEYVIDVLFYGRPIKGSPFKAQAFDWSRIAVRSMPANGFVGRTLEFDIDAAAAGSGNLEIMVNDGTIPCSVQNRGNRQFHASFVPKDARPHFVQMRFNGREVPGSPWRIDILSAANVTASGSGLQIVPINRAAMFEVRTGTQGVDGGTVSAVITSSTGRQVPSQVMSAGGGLYQVTYSPMEVGQHTIQVLYEGMAIPSSPFLSKVYDPNAIVVSPVPPGMIGKPVEFTIDVTQAGEGQLEIMVNRGAVPNSVRQLRKGVFMVSFVPRDPRPHIVDIKFNGELLYACPITVPIMDTSRVTVHGDGLRQVAVNKQSYFRVNTQSAGDADLAVRVTSPSGSQVAPSVVGSSASGYDVEFRPTEVGTYRVDVAYGGEAIPGSPFQVKVFDPSRVKVTGVVDGIVGVQSSFTVDIGESGEGSMEISIKGPSGGNVQNHVAQVAPGQFAVNYTPMEHGAHKATVLFNKDHVPGSPVDFAVIDASHVTATGEGLGLVPCHKAATFSINAPGAKLSDLDIKVTGPDGRGVPIRVSHAGGSVYAVEYTPVLTGEYRIDVRYFDQVIGSSPFTAKAWDASKVLVSNITPGRIGKPSHFQLDASRAGQGNLEIVVSVGTENVPNFVKAEGNARFDVSFTPQVVDTHNINVRFNGELVPGSPFQHHVIDGGRVTASGDGLRKVPANKPAFFEVLTQAVGGEAPLQVDIAAPSGRSVPSRLSGSARNGYLVEYTPVEVGFHRLTVLYADVNIRGSPFEVEVYDPSKIRVGAIADGVMGQPLRFDVDASAAGTGQMTVEVHGQSTKPRAEVTSQGGGRFGVAFVPHEVSPHQVHILFNGHHVPGSPFPAKVFDWSTLTLDWDAIRRVPVKKPVTLTLDAKGAPEAPIEATVFDPYNRTVVTRVTAMGTRYQIVFTPINVGPHTVNIQYGGQAITGSPFTCNVFDAGQIKMSDVTKQGLLNQEMGFTVDVSQAGQGALEVELTAGTRKVALERRRLDEFTFRFIFMPLSVSDHVADVIFNYERVPGSPLVMTVFDSTNIAVNWDSVRLVPVNKAFVVDIDPKGAPDAAIETNVRDPNGKQLPVQVSKHGHIHQVVVTPLTVGPHVVTLTYGGQAVPGSPCTVSAYDTALVRIHEASTVGAVKQDLSLTGSPLNVNVYDTKDMVVSAESARLVPVGRAITVELDPRGMPDAQIEAKITDPLGRPVQPRLAKQGGVILIEFTPLMVGSYSVDLRCVGQPVPGSPFLCKAYDLSKVRLDDVTHQAKQGDELGFTVDTSEAGPGELEVEALWQGQVLQAFHNRLEEDRHRFTFSPGGAGEHLASIKFNGGHIPNTPLAMTVEDPGFRMFVKDDSFLPNLALGMTGTSTVEAQGAKISLSDVIVRVTAPNGELVPAKIVQQPDGDYKVEYSSRYTGRHTVEILYAGQAIMGSPFFVEIYDPNKIRVEGTRTGMLGTRMEFDIIRNEAGRAELGLSIVGPSGRNVPYEMTPIAMGDHVIYMPVEVGPHHIHITYGGLDVPGCPIRQEILDVGSAVASGDGLVKGIENRPTTFLVDTKGRKGNLDVQVDGPNSIAKCNIDPEPSGRYVVTYIPVEVGSYNVTVKWNGREIEGSPFHPKVVDPTKVLPVGGWETLLDAQGRMHLKVHDRKTIQFETIMAGPGEMRVELQGPDGLTPVEVERRDSRYYVHFTPRMEGDYYLRVLWCGIPLPRCPLLGMARGEQAVVSVNHEKVVLTGHGLLEARVREEADFVIDGTEAGPGTPTVKLSGVKCDIDVRVLPIGANKYKCVYVPQIPGAYLLNIMWSDRQVRGSPFKVNVVQSSDASKVMASGEGLKGGIFGKEIKAVIDTRRAGPGELTAHCMGPVKVAFCELHDHHDGTFTLSIKPQEAGKHILQVKYGGEHVPGSPFLLRVAGAPDASKVRVSGPGIEHGILATYQSRFIVETRGAGAGQLTVRIRGPKGAFRVEMQRESQKDRTILCRYEPQEVGDYIISVKWSGDHVPGSPIHVQIFDTQEELERFMVENPARRHNALAVSDKRWTEDI